MVNAEQFFFNFNAIGDKRSQLKKHLDITITVGNRQNLEGKR